MICGISPNGDTLPGPRVPGGNSKLSMCRHQHFRIGHPGEVLSSARQESIGDTGSLSLGPRAESLTHPTRAATARSEVKPGLLSLVQDPRPLLAGLLRKAFEQPMLSGEAFLPRGREQADNCRVHLGRVTGSVRLGPVERTRQSDLHALIAGRAACTITDESVTDRAFDAALDGGGHILKGLEQARLKSTEGATDQLRSRASEVMLSESFIRVVMGSMRRYGCDRRPRRNADREGRLIARTPHLATAQRVVSSQPAKRPGLDQSPSCCTVIPMEREEPTPWGVWVR